jgi:deoxyribodipyrimidine photo-lyase
MRTVVWFRGKDLRVADHLPLEVARARGEVIPLFVLDPHFFAPEQAQKRGHRIQFLLESLAQLMVELRALGSDLVVVAGRSVDVVPQLAAAWNADEVVAQRWSEPFARERDRRVDVSIGGRLKLLEGETLLPPGTLRTGAGRPYSVFTQFARACRRLLPPPQPGAAPQQLPPLPLGLNAVSSGLPALSDLGLTRNAKILPGGERAALLRLGQFLAQALPAYGTQRDRMDLAGTSRLSADLKFGTLSVRQVWHTVAACDGPGAYSFQNELLWREFAHSTLWDRPELLKQPFRPAFAHFPWREDPAGWQAWLTGTTGYPIVDAAARQLQAEGFVHNRARMIAASFLCKHLLIDYRLGEAHYQRLLTDGDWALNNMGWQWCAGSGCDAQPYFRVFNPVLQGQKFDPNGDYVRRWVPELARLPASCIHWPKGAKVQLLQAAGVRLGENYPEPIVEHSFARGRFLALAAQYLRAPVGDST